MASSAPATMAWITTFAQLDGGIGGGHGIGVAQADMHQAEVAFMGDSFGYAFQHNRVAQPGGGGDRVGGGVALDGGDSANAEAWRAGAGFRVRSGDGRAGLARRARFGSGDGFAGGGVSSAPMPSSRMSVSVNTSMPRAM